MLIEFTVGNHLSFKEKKTLSLEASSIKEYEENILKANNYSLLKTTVIYGANSSGKSNLVKSLTTMLKIVRESAKMSSTDKIEVEPFLLNSETENNPSYFEILILIDGTRYRYGFEADKEIVFSEWLFECKTNKNETPLFYRDKDKIEVTRYFSEGKGVEERTRENALFLSSVDQWNGNISKKILAWFNDRIMIISGLSHESRRGLTIRFNNEPSLKRHIDKLISHLSLGFNEFMIDPNNQNAVLTQHNKYNPVGDVIGSQWFDISKQESSGTNKIFDLAGHISWALIVGGVLVIDELDAKLHPLLTIAIAKLFNSPEDNKYNAQLIFASHDTNLLSCGSFRRDQIYFTEKNQFEETDLYSLVEYKNAKGEKIRNDRSFEKDYINGRYGAIPFIGNFSNILSNGADKKD